MFVSANSTVGDAGFFAAVGLALVPCAAPVATAGADGDDALFDVRGGMERAGVADRESAANPALLSPSGLLINARATAVSRPADRHHRHDSERRAVGAKGHVLCLVCVAAHPRAVGNLVAGAVGGI